jgi:hypothetical protein
MRTVYAVVDGMVLGLLAFEHEADAQEWAKDNQETGESLGLAVQPVQLYPDFKSAPKRPEFF